jgi:hypothetical protein
VPQPQESQPDIPQEASPEEEPFEIELVVPESPTAQDSLAEEQQPEDHGTEDKTNEEHPTPSDAECLWIVIIPKSKDRFMEQPPMKVVQP